MKSLGGLAVFDVERFTYWRVGTAIRIHGVYSVSISTWRTDERALIELLSNILFDGNVVNIGKYWLWRANSNHAGNANYAVGCIEQVAVIRHREFESVCRMWSAEHRFVFTSQAASPFTWWGDAMETFKDYV